MGGEMPGIEAVANDQLEAGPPTAGMVRQQAFEGAQMWMGDVSTEAGAVSGWHHHGDHETYGRVIAGSVHFEFGPDGAESVDLGPGDYFHVSAHAVHRESNPGAGSAVVTLVRLGPGPTVVNVDGPSSD
jgi:uncharacterized RmlC-like cupin family protein